MEPEIALPNGEIIAGPLILRNNADNIMVPQVLSATSTSPAVDHSNGDKSRPCVLLVEDNPINLKVSATSL